MEILSRDELINLPEHFREIEVAPGKAVLLKGLSAEELLELEDMDEAHKKEGTEWNERGLWILQRTIFGQDRKLLFSGDEGYAALKKLPSSLLQKLSFASQKLSYPEDFEAFLKKYGWAATSDFFSDSASPSESSTQTTSTSISDKSEIGKPSSTKNPGEAQ